MEREHLFSDEIKVNICKSCGDTAPPGKEYCWCCSRSGKLHVMDSCDKDACKIEFKNSK